jgi:hypothetical protein
VTISVLLVTRKIDDAGHHRSQFGLAARFSLCKDDFQMAADSFLIRLEVHDSARRGFASPHSGTRVQVRQCRRARHGRKMNADRHQGRTCAGDDLEIVFHRVVQREESIAAAANAASIAGKFQEALTRDLRF